jgi:uncharacterized protein
MQVEHHDLHHEFPELGEQMTTLKTSNAHFAKLFAQYHEMTNEVEKLETNDVPTDDVTFEDLKKKRAKLKDELYQMLIAAKSGR